MLGHLVLSVPSDKDETGKEDISASEKVRVFASCPVLNGSVAGSDQTCLNGDTDYSSDYVVSSNPIIYTQFVIEDIPWKRTWAKAPPTPANSRGND